MRCIYVEFLRRRVAAASFFFILRLFLPRVNSMRRVFKDVLFMRDIKPSPICATRLRHHDKKSEHSELFFSLRYRVGLYPERIRRNNGGDERGKALYQRTILLPRGKKITQI